MKPSTAKEFILKRLCYKWKQTSKRGVSAVFIPSTPEGSLSILLMFKDTAFPLMKCSLSTGIYWVRLLPIFKVKGGKSVTEQHCFFQSLLSLILGTSLPLASSDLFCTIPREADIHRCPFDSQWKIPKKFLKGLDTCSLRFYIYFDNFNNYKF